MSTFRDRLRCLLTSRPLPPMTVDLGTYRRLLAMRERVIREDPTLAEERNRGLEHVVYAAICRGLVESEKDAGVRYDELTGLPL